MTRQIETVEIGDIPGLEIEILQDGGFQKQGVSKFPKTLNFEEISNILSGVVSKVASSPLLLSDSRPDQLEVELQFSLKGKGTLVLVNSEATASIKVRARWDK